MSGLDRIRKEFNDLVGEPLTYCGIVVSLFDDNDITNWKVSMLGPKDTSYEGGLFYLSVHFPRDYPKKGPEVCFITPIYHLNVNPKAIQDGIPLGHLSSYTLHMWKEKFTMREVLVDIFALFYSYAPYDPYGFDIVKEFLHNNALYEEKARKFTKQYADPTIFFKMYPKDQDWVFK